MSDNEKLRQSLKDWDAKAEKAVAKFPERKKQFVTGSNAPIKRLYTPCRHRKSGL